MQHFNKQLRTRLLTLYLSAGLVMGWLPGCGSQDLEIADTVAESAVTATADATDVITFPSRKGRRSLPFMWSRWTAFPMILPWYGRIRSIGSGKQWREIL